MRKILLFLLLAALAAPATLIQPPTARAATLSTTTSVTLAVNSSLADAPDAAPGNGVCETAAGNGICTLRAAIMEANALPGADVIDLPAGTYTLTRTGYEDAALNGDLDITADLTITGAGMDATTINGNGGVTQGRVLQVLPGVIASLSGMCIQNGYGADDTGDDFGGGIRNDGSLTLNQVCLRYNHAVFSGGAVFNTGALSIFSSFFSNNSSNNYGGAITNQGSLTIDSSAFNHNSGELPGGAIYSNGGTLRLSRSRFNNNTAYGGGALSILYNDATSIDSSMFYANTSLEDGGAIEAYQSRLIMTNVTLTGNFARRNGGGLAVHLSAEATDLSNLTIVNNQADSDNNGSGSGGGIYHFAQGEQVRIGNSILATNTLDGGVFDPLDDCSGPLTSQGYNLIVAVAGCTITGVTSGNQTGLNPMLGGIGNNGGPTPSLMLLPGSPAIDAGNPAGCGDHLGAALLFDQRGFFRHTGARCDMGAVEYQSIAPLIQNLPLLWR